MIPSHRRRRSETLSSSFVNLQIINQRLMKDSLGFTIIEDVAGLAERRNRRFQKEEPNPLVFFRLRLLEIDEDERRCEEKMRRRLTKEDSERIAPSVDSAKRSASFGIAPSVWHSQTEESKTKEAEELFNFFCCFFLYFTIQNSKQQFFYAE
uniref:Uncharacterized protein n=1 Tax=Pseudopediastrum sp. CL0201VA TaxID=2184484 RepID=A0A2U8GJT3_9CHLO|nr:hypothetical protein [Pseudopediastrum sp. CL0201VA]AWI68899.1 hypothetical protein [Pseudopediastrum sp. CL0201VA]